MGNFKSTSMVWATVKEYLRLKEMAVNYLESEEGKEEDPELTPNEWILGVLLAEKLYTEGKIDEEAINNIPGYYRDWRK